MKRLTYHQVIQIHSLLILETGGSDGIRDEGLLDSALNLPFQSFDGEDLYKTIQSKAARLGFSLVNNHAFVDGNKRNGIIIECTNEEIVDIGLSLATGHLHVNELLTWIIDHS